MRTMHLFAGVGGGLLADLILGHEPVCAVEWDPYCCAVLRERAAEGWFPGLHVYEGDVRLWDPSPWAGRVDCIAAGFPCQDLSCAGRGAGIGGERSGLWVEVMRAVDAIRPRFVFLENVPAIRTRGGEVVLAALRQRGYRCRCGTLAAEDVGAPHRRERWWCLASADAERSERRQVNGACRVDRQDGIQQWQESASWIGELRAAMPDASSLLGTEKQRGEQDGDSQRASEVANSQGTVPRNGLRDEDVADSDSERSQARVKRGDQRVSRGRQAHDSTTVEGRRDRAERSWWSVEPDVGRVAHGVASRVDRLRGIGNGQVPLQAALAWVLLGGPVA